MDDNKDKNFDNTHPHQIIVRIGMLFRCGQKGGHDMHWWLYNRCNDLDTFHWWHWFCAQEKKPVVKEYFKLHHYLLHMLSLPKFDAKAKKNLRKICYHLAIIYARNFVAYEGSHYLHKVLCHTDQVILTIASYDEDLWPLCVPYW